MIRCLTAVLATVLAGLATAQTRPPLLAPSPSSAATTAVPETVTDTALDLGAADDRMTVPVSIGGNGPWPFVIDTGAERSVVSRQLAERLGLAAGPLLHIVAMAGPKIVPSSVVPALSVSSVPPTSVVAPMLEQSDLGASGLLGIDALQGHRVEIDFDRAAMSLAPSRRRRVTAGNQGDEIVVVARSVFGQLIVTDARWRGRRIAVVIDTGSSMTVGNPALQRLITAHAKRLGLVTGRSVTGVDLTAEAFAIGDLALGGIHITELPVAFADAAPFRRFGLERRPAVMLGMDALRLFRRVRIDFANRAIEFRLPRSLANQLKGPPV